MVSFKSHAVSNEKPISFWSKITWTDFIRECRGIIKMQNGRTFEKVLHVPNWNLLAKPHGFISTF